MEEVTLPPSCYLLWRTVQVPAPSTDLRSTQGLDVFVEQTPICFRSAEEGLLHPQQHGHVWQGLGALPV